MSGILGEKDEEGGTDFNLSPLDRGGMGGEEATVKLKPKLPGKVVEVRHRLEP
jgi:hypothetical protein